jgi:hypothetical protein
MFWLVPKFLSIDLDYGAPGVGGGIIKFQTPKDAAITRAIIATIPGHLQTKFVGSGTEYSPLNTQRNGPGAVKYR